MIDLEIYSNDRGEWSDAFTGCDAETTHNTAGS